MVVVASIITPPDMLSTIVCTIPLMALYEISILLCVRKRSDRSWKKSVNGNKADTEKWKSLFR